MKKILTLLAVSTVALTVGACTNRGSNLPPPGEYKNTTRSTNAYGTETVQTRETEVYYDQYGNKRARVESETSRDPEGMFNKTTTNKTTTYVE